MKLHRAWWLVGALLSPAAGAAQLAPPSTGGVVELDRLLQRIAQPRRVLMIAAHPDDEDTGLLARVALGDGARAAYLSLSRGEGGQNLIGRELGATLGLLRTRELEAARSIDGAEQYFSRAFDFGYTRSLEETATKWPLDSLLKDAIRVVRKFRPHVMVSVFSGTPRDGHGQHQAAGVTARRAFELAGDPTVFPELRTEEGLEPWTPLKLYRSTRFDQSSTNVELQTGDLDGRTGRSYHQIAMESRSQHRSQDMGMIQASGPQQSRLRVLENRTSASDTVGVFDGIAVDAGPLGRVADSLRGELSPVRMTRLVPALAEALSRFGNDDRKPLLEQALAIAAGVVVDAVASDDAVVPGQEFRSDVSVYNSGSHSVRVLGVQFDPADGVRTRAFIASEASGQREQLGPGGAWEQSYQQLVSETRPTQPYFIARQHNGMMYDWTGTRVEDRGRPYQRPWLQARVQLEVAGTPITLTREVSFRFRDQAVGEIRREVRVVPTIDVSLSPSQVVWPVDQFRERTFAVTLTFNGTDPLSGSVTIGAEGWPRVEPQRFRFSTSGETQQFEFTVTPPRGAIDTRATLSAVATADEGQEYAVGVRSVTYGHIRPAYWVQTAEADVVLASIVAPPVATIGYVRGAADRIPEAMAQIGMPVQLLDAADLESGDLSGYDVIVVGPRAYEIDEALRRHNDRLLEYSRNGGHLIVQYQQYQFVRGNYAAHPLTIGRPHDRVTDETAPMRVLDPGHPVFNGVNRITEQDWLGWPQERGLYFAQTWDDAYQPLIESQDPDRDPVRGVMLYSEYGAGTYVYTGISFFRALPAGNPGAFKLFLNLVGAGRRDVP